MMLEKNIEILIFQANTSVLRFRWVHSFTLKIEK